MLLRSLHSPSGEPLDAQDLPDAAKHAHCAAARAVGAAYPKLVKLCGLAEGTAVMAAAFAFAAHAARSIRASPRVLAAACISLAGKLDGVDWSSDRVLELWNHVAGEGLVQEVACAERRIISAIWGVVEDE